MAKFVGVNKDVFSMSFKAVREAYSEFVLTGVLTPSISSGKQMTIGVYSFHGQKLFVTSKANGLYDVIVSGEILNSLGYKTEASDVIFVCEATETLKLFTKSSKNTFPGAISLNVKDGEVSFIEEKAYIVDDIKFDVVVSRLFDIGFVSTDVENFDIYKAVTSLTSMFFLTR